MSGERYPSIDRSNVGDFTEAHASIGVAQFVREQQLRANEQSEDVMANHHTLDPTRAAADSPGDWTTRSDAREWLLAGLPVTERRLSLNGLSTAVLEGGPDTGTPIVLLHGPGAYAAQWRRVIPALATSYRIVAPDLPGHGATELIDGSLTEPQLEDFVSGWLDDLIECTCNAPPVLVGHTLGGAIAGRFASDCAKRLAALVLVDTLGLTPFRPQAAFGAALHELLSNPAEHTHDALWRQCMFDLDRVTKRLDDEWHAIKAYNLELLQAPGRLASLQQLMDRFAVHAIPPTDLERITVRTTLIWGREDRATPLAIAQQASERFGWPLHVIDAAADDPTLEQPEIFLATLRGVLDPV